MNENITTTTTITTTATAVMIVVEAVVVVSLICKNHGFILHFLFFGYLRHKKGFLTVFENGKYSISETFL